MTETDLRVTIEKKTDQLNFEDFLGGITRIVTITGVKKGTKEQQYDISIEGDERYWRPPATVLKLLVEAWGDEAKKWVGRRAALYGDPGVMFGGKRLGGIRVSHLSHIEGPVTANLSVTRGKRELFTVEPLPDSTPSPPPVSTPSSPAVSTATLADLADMFERKGIPEDARLAGVNQLTGGSATDLETITEADAQQVLAALKSRPDVEAAS